MKRLKVGLTSYEKGYLTGVAMGMAKVLAMDFEKALRLLLEEKVTTRFGPLSNIGSERLANWPADRLLALAEALLNVESLQELGLED